MQKAQRAVYGLLAAAALIWLAAIISPAYLAADGELFFALMIRKGFDLACHQIPDRSFFLWGHPLAVCARCSGVYFGIAAGLIVYPLFRALERIDLPPRYFLLAALTPAAIDFLLGYLHVVENTRESRFLTGSAAGIGLAFYIMPAIVCLIRESALDGRTFLWKNRV